MSDTSQGEGWWQASDGKWYPPKDAAPGAGWWLASDGNWYPPTDQPPGEGWWLASDGRYYPPKENLNAAPPAPPSAQPADPVTTAVPTAPAAPKPPPAKVAPVPPKAAPARPVPAKAVPAKAVPAKPVPAKAIAAKAVPAKAVPSKAVAKAAAPPAKAVPTKASPAKSVPAKTVAKTPPAKVAPSKPAAAKDGPPKADRPAPSTGNGGATKGPRTIAAASATPSANPSAGVEAIAARDQQSQLDAKMLADKRRLAASRALASLANLADDDDPPPARELRESRALRQSADAPAAAPPAPAEPPPAPAAASKPAPAPAPTAEAPAPPSTPPAKAQPTAPAAKTGNGPAAAAASATAPAPRANAPRFSLVTGPVRPPAAIERPAPVQAPPQGGPAFFSPPTERPAEDAEASAPLIEVKPSPLNTDVDRIGDRLVVFKDRVELHDRNGGVRQSIRGDQITDVVAQRKFTGSMVSVESIDGTVIVAKGLRPEQAEEVRDLILRRTRRGDNPPQTRAPQGRTSRPPIVGPQADPPAPRARDDRPRIDVTGLLAKLDDLHAAGVLTDAELEEKRSLVRRLAEGTTLATTL